jgi:extracellular factor (EF) 3-hydroxypalmitic acid methyl ester biosynthesis protein
MSLPDVEQERAMSKPNQQDHVSLLSAAKNGLVYLTANDWALVADKATLQQFKAGEQLVQKGKRTHGIFLLLKGTALAQIPSHGLGRNIGPGEVCGEISFLDELPATANVVASEAVEVYYLDRPTLQSLFELFPHMGSRFYHSLAAILSRRLREMIGPQAPPAQSPAKKDSA